jgi:hypothetical protein
MDPDFSNSLDLDPDSAKSQDLDPDSVKKHRRKLHTVNNRR